MAEQHEGPGDGECSGTTEIPTRPLNREAASARVERSLERLQTRVIDLLPTHELIHVASPSGVYGPGGAIESLLAARKAGKAR